MTESSSVERLNQMPEITMGEMLACAKSVIDQWDFGDESNIEATRLFTLNVTHWLLETFGQKASDGSGDLSIYPYMDSRLDKTGKIANTDLPLPLRELFTSVFQDEVVVMGSSSVVMTSAHDHIKDPGRGELSQKLIQKGLTLEQMVKHFHENPMDYVEVLAANIETVVPRVKLVLRAYSWGLVFMIDHNGIQLAPFGSEDDTWTPTNYVINQKNDGELARTACELAFLGTSNAWSDFNLQNVKISTDRLKELEDRLSGKSQIPLI